MPSNNYITVQGDTWDSVAFRFYGNENYADVLMEANPDLIEWFVFDSGIKIVIPDIREIEAERIARTFPEWRKEETAEEIVYG